MAISEQPQQGRRERQLRRVACAPTTCSDLAVVTEMRRRVVACAGAPQQASANVLLERTHRRISSANKPACTRKSRQRAYGQQARRRRGYLLWYQGCGGNSQPRWAAVNRYGAVQFDMIPVLPLLRWSCSPASCGGPIRHSQHSAAAQRGARLIPPPRLLTSVFSGRAACPESSVHSFGPCFQGRRRTLTSSAKRLYVTAAFRRAAALREALT